MSEEKHQLKVFLCHAHSDKGKVRELYLRLKADGVDAWLDKEKLLPGQDWELEIRKAVRESDVVVVCLSREFNQAGFRQKEVRLALDTAMEKPEGAIFIIPARLEECDTLESLRKWHWVDLFDGDGYEKLIRALRVRAETIGLTLQAKRNWLPNISQSSFIAKKTPSEIKSLDARPVPFQGEEKKDLTSQPNEYSELTRLKKQRKSNTVIIVTVIGFVGTIIAGLLGSPLIERWFFPSDPASLVTLVVVSITSPPVNTPRPTATRVPLDPEITDDLGVEMILVPEGDLVRGSNFHEIDERPQKTIFLRDFYIDKYEVTNAKYKECVDAGYCELPTESDLVKGVSEFSIYSQDHVDYPVVSVTWDMALSFCSWRGARLPLEMEWEKAARGSDARLFPWGNEYNDSKANLCDKQCTETTERNEDYNDGYRYTSPVYEYPDGASPHGVLGMAGNVWEWVTGEYRPDGYSYNSQEFFLASLNYGVPIKTPEPNKHVIRGGSWWNSKNFLRTSYRMGTDTSADPRIGFRCARDVTQ